MKPIKVANADLSKKYAIVAGSLAEVKQKGSAKLDLDVKEEKISILLEDGTILEDEDYFTYIPDHSLLIVKTVKQFFRPTIPLDDPYMNSLDNADVTDHALSNRPMTPAAVMAHKLRRDVSLIIKFSTAELEMIANATPDELMSSLDSTEEDIERLQETCHTHLVERENTRDALYLLEMHSKLNQGHDSSEPNKKRKT